MITGGVEDDWTGIDGRCGPVEGPTRAVLLADECPRGGVFNVLPRRTWTSVVQDLRQAVWTLQLSGLFVRGSIENGQLETPAKTSLIGIRMSDGDRISLSGNVGLWCGDGYLARACIRRHVTLSAGLRLFLRRARVTSRWTSRESVYRPRTRVVRKNEPDDRSEHSRQNNEPDSFEIHLWFILIGGSFLQD